jgi:hypothetical protein
LKLSTTESTVAGGTEPSAERFSSASIAKRFSESSAGSRRWPPRRRRRGGRILTFLKKRGNL